MAIVSGTTGHVVIGTDVASVGSAGTTAVAHINRWSGDISRDIFEVSEFDGTSTAKNKIGGMHHMTGTCEGFLDSANAFNLTKMKAADLVPATGTGGSAGPPKVPNTGEMELRYFSNAVGTGPTHGTFFFKAIITSLSLSVEKTGQATFSMSFESSGVITEDDPADGS